jgi:predicted GIY-YIG superfamily endonuclease
MYIVYVLISLKDADRHYVGLTEDLEKRLKAHNAKKSLFSKKYSPWGIETFITFKNEYKARKFEKYLKSGSGYAFLKKHFI